MKLKDKLILTDCDGVLLDWNYGFTKWMKKHGFEYIGSEEYSIHKRFDIEKSQGREYVRRFNESAAMGWLPAFRDSVKYVKKLHEEHGYIFHVITSLSTDEYAGKLRKKNLEALFGKTAFDGITCLDTGADKNEALEKYLNSGCIWIEDKVINADVGLEYGLEPILIAHDHNKNVYDPNLFDFVRLDNWKEIYEYVTFPSVKYDKLKEKKVASL